jgi:hypothetical protein
MLANHREKENPGYILLDVIFTHVTVIFFYPLTPSGSFSNIIERNCALYPVPCLGIVTRVDVYSI